MKPFFVFENVSFQYPYREGRSIPALEGISLAIQEGEFVALVGANGSGKSTFARLASGLLVPQGGSVRAAGLDTRQPAHLPRIHATVGMVFQFPEDQIISTTVEEDVAFGPENLGLPPDEIRRRVDQALEEVGMLESRRRPPHLLSAGQVQRVALAGVLAMSPNAIIFDEASTMLDPAGRHILMEAMQRLHRQGKTILFITHFMDEAARAGRVIAFHNGKVAADGAPGEIFSDAARLDALGLELPTAVQAAESIRKVIPGLRRGLIVLPDLLAALPEFSGMTGQGEILNGRHPAAESGVHEVLIEVSQLGYVYLRGTPAEQRALSGVSLKVPAGQAHGLAGKTGSGKSTLLQHLNGLLRPQEGRVRVGKFDLGDPHLDRREVVRQVGLVFQNPEAQFFEYYAGDEIAFGPRQLKIAEPGNPLLAERVRWAMERVGLVFEEFKDRPLFTLSGGERRKVALASTLALQPSILLLDEPTAGLDPRSRQELLHRLAEMQSAGMTILLSSHQMEDMAVLTQAMTVIQKGSVAFSGDTVEIFADPVRVREYGLDLPAAAQAADGLRKKGWPVPPGVLIMEDLDAWAAAASSAGLPSTSTGSGREGR